MSRIIGILMRSAIFTGRSAIRGGGGSVKEQTYYYFYE